MSDRKHFKYIADRLCVYDAPQAVQLLQQFACGDGGEQVRAYAALFRLAAPYGSLRRCITQAVLTADNLFTKAAAAGETALLPSAVLRGVKSDLALLETAAKLTSEELIALAEGETAAVLQALPQWELGTDEPPLTENWTAHLEDLAAWHRENGYGVFAQYAAFTWRDGALQPITSLNTIRLTDLKRYERQRQQAIDNTLSFLSGYPANNLLLYGDRGTGKSSTVHALLNEYRERGLRMLEIAKSDIPDLTRIREQLAESPMKFIIFIDDLSFDAHEDSFGALKAALEGSLSGRQANTLIYATSNRRHLIKENYADRQNDVHLSDTLQEELSLSERFGLSIYFPNPDKAEFHDITAKIAADRGLNLDEERLLAAAESWARRRGGRSPRCARQFIDYVESCMKQHIDW